MNHALTLAMAGALSFGVALTPRTAHALGPLTLEAAAKVGGASNPISYPSDSSITPNPLGFGIGGRAGVSILAFYGGVVGMYYFGSSTDVTERNGQTVSLSLHTVQYGVEGGLDVSVLGLVTVRPQVGFGNIDFSASVADTNVANSGNYFYLEPGVTGLLTFGTLLVGADVNALWVPGLSDSNVSLAASGQIGFQL